MRERLRAGVRASILSIALNVALGCVKLVAGLLGNSYALIADAVESLADCVGSAIVWGGLAISARPADADHPYGHGKAEPLAALAVGAILLAAAVGITVEAVHEILRPHHAPAAFTLVVLVLVVVVKEGLFRLLTRVGSEIESTAVHADAWHQRTDALTSIIAGVGITFALFAGPGYESADDWAAVGASFVIAFNGLRFLRRAMHELMDARAPDDVLICVEQTAMDIPGVRRVEKVLARKMGTAYWVDMHIEVDPDMPVRQAHEIAHRVKDGILASQPRVLDVLIHVEPYSDQTGGQ